MDKDAVFRMIDEMQSRFPGLTPELATQTILVESLRACRSVMDLTRLPVDPQVLNRLREQGLLESEEWLRLMGMLDPAAAAQDKIH